MSEIGIRHGTPSGYALKLAAKQPHKRPWLGLSLTALFFALASPLALFLLVVVFTAVEEAQGEIHGGLVRFVFMGCALFAMVPLYPAYHFGRKLTAKGALEILERDARAPILYLRSFDDDRGGLANWWLRGPLKLLGAINSGKQTSFGSKKALGGATSEDALVSHLKKIGPVVAIGRPFETLPTLGAARLYMDESGWQDAVKGIADEAQYVVLGMGASGGLRWEYEFAFRSLPANKIIVYLDVAKGKAQEPRYAEFRDFLQQNFDIQLPPYWHDAHAIRFDDHWRPIFVRDQFRFLTDLRRRAIAWSPRLEGMSDKRWAREIDALHTVAAKAGSPMCIVQPELAPPEDALSWVTAETTEERAAIFKDWSADTEAVFSSANTQADLAEFITLAKESGQPRRWICAVRRPLAKSLRDSAGAHEIKGFELRRSPISSKPRFLGFDTAEQVTAMPTKWWPSIGWLGWVFPRAATLRSMGLSALQPFFKSIGRKTPGVGYRRGSWILGLMAVYIVAVVASAGETDTAPHTEGAALKPTPPASAPPLAVPERSLQTSGGN